ncbi:hypothetical protein [Ascidiaceihabitans sp.]|uniref:hypothetical protein n=1 Tax=Ascidiaceihabitans sp. TaxID=1872644 RepID=UPI003298D8FB
MKFISVLLLGFWATVASAYDFPARYSVIGIPDGDLLPIFAAQDDTSDILAGYVFDAKSIEVVSVSADGIWGQVNVRDTTGWVTMSSMLKVEDDMPLTLACFGAEPSWNIDLSDDKSSAWNTPETRGDVQFTKSDDKLGYDGKITMTETSARPGLQVDFNAKLTPAACTYPNTENAFGLKIEILLKGYTGFASPEGDETVSGCCSLRP